MKTALPCDLLRLLDDSRESTLTVEEELAFIRIAVRLMASGMPYSEVIECVFAQIGNSRYE